MTIENKTGARRAVHSLHGMVMPLRIEDPPDVVWVVAGLPEKNGGTTGHIYESREHSEDSDAEIPEVNLEVESFVRMKSLPPDIQAKIRKHWSTTDGTNMQLHPDTAREVTEAHARKSILTPGGSTL